MIRTSALLLLLAACQPADAPPPEQAPSAPASAPAASPGPEPLTPEGWGPLRIGMTRAEVVAAAGEDANPQAVGGPEPDRCDQFRPERAPEGMIVMLEEGRLTRITLVEGSELKTERGFGVGASADSVAAAYGAEATITPHKYRSAPASYITVWTTPPPAPEPRGIVYETFGEGRVSQIHAGGPSIQYVEGCL